VGGEAFRVVSCHDCVIENNTYHTTTPGAAMRILAVGFGGSSGCNVGGLENQDLIITNNLFFATSPFAYVIASNQGSVPGLQMHHNAWWAGVGNNVTALGSDIAFAGEPTSLYSIDPQVSLPADPRPASGSPLLGAGSTPSTFNRGNGAGACWSTPPNIGAR